LSTLKLMMGFASQQIEGPRLRPKRFGPLTGDNFGHQDVPKGVQAAALPLDGRRYSNMLHD